MRERSTRWIKRWAQIETLKLSVVTICKRYKTVFHCCCLSPSLSLSISLIFFSQWGRDHQIDHHHIARISLTSFFLFFLRECKSPEEFAKRISSTAKQSRDYLHLTWDAYLQISCRTHTHTHAKALPISVFNKESYGVVRLHLCYCWARYF